jgi:hypothetical protein
MIPKTFGAVGMPTDYAPAEAGTSVTRMRVDVVTKEYPPEVYGAPVSTSPSS